MKRACVACAVTLAIGALAAACGSGDDDVTSSTTPDASTASDASNASDANGTVDATTPSDSGHDAADAADSAAGDASDGSLVDAEADAQADADADAGTDSGPDAAGVIYMNGVTVSTLAGSDAPGSQDGNGAIAQFNNPTGIALDADGNVLVTDYDGSLVRRVTPAGDVTTIGATTGFVGPFAASVATDGKYFVETDFNSGGAKDLDSGTIWQVAALDGSVAVPTVVAAGFGRPRGVAKIAGGNLFLADRLRSIVGVLTVDGGAFTYLAGASGDAGFGDGNGAAAQFNGPLGAAAMSDGSVLVADSANNRIRRVTALGEVTTFAGDGTAGWKDGARLSAELSLPTDVAVDAADNVYITDAGNHVVRRILANGTMVTLAGDGTQSFANGAGDLAEFYGLEGIDVTADGKTVYVSDGNEGDGSAHHRVRKIVVP